MEYYWSGKNKGIFTFATAWIYLESYYAKKSKPVIKRQVPYWCRSGPAGSCVVVAVDKYTQTTEILWRKRDGMATLLSEIGQEGHREPKREGQPLPGQAFAAFLGALPPHYAQVHCRWLPFTDNQGQNAGNYFKEKDITAQGGKWLNWLHSILGRFGTDFTKLKILSKDLLPQSRVREF